VRCPIHQRNAIGVEMEQLLRVIIDKPPECRGRGRPGIDLAQGPTVGVQVGCMLGVHRATVTAPSPPGLHISARVAELQHMSEALEGEVA
jgi:hypothetical protein